MLITPTELKSAWHVPPLNIIPQFRTSSSEANVTFPESEGTRESENTHAEVMRISGGQYIEDRDADSSISCGDHMFYLSENAMSAIPNFQFWVLGLFSQLCLSIRSVQMLILVLPEGCVTMVLTVILSLLWMEAKSP